MLRMAVVKREERGKGLLHFIFEAGEKITRSLGYKYYVVGCTSPATYHVAMKNDFNLFEEFFYNDITEEEIKAYYKPTPEILKQFDERGQNFRIVGKELI